VPLAPEHALALAELFQRSDHHCFCRYLHFQGDKYAWQDRLANHWEKSREELIARVQQGSDEARGVIALETSGRVVGWLKLSPALSVPKIYDQRLYRRLPCFEGEREGVYTLGCFFVDPEYRGRGLAGPLALGAIQLARTLGARSLEALPRGGSGVSPAERWLGRPEPLLELGFQVVYDFAPYPVLRLTL